MADSVFIGWFGTIKFESSAGSIAFGASILPDADNTYDLGSASFRWKSVYVGTSVLMGGAMALGTTSTLGIVAQNTTAAAAGAQQISPGLDLVGQGWKTDATAASREVRFRQEVLPVQGTANPSGTWKLKVSINSGAFTEILTASPSAVTSGVPILAPNGLVGAPGLAFSSAPTSGFFFDTVPIVSVSGAARVAFGTQVTLRSDGSLAWSSTTDPLASADASISRGAAGRVDTTKAFRMTPVAFAALPTAAEGAIASVNDSNTATWGATIAGGGANKVLAYYNGANWTVAGA